MDTLIRNQFGTPEAMNRNAIQPLVSATPMVDLNGQAFDARIQCPSTDNLLQVLIGVGASNDLNPVIVSRDTDFDGTLDAQYTAPAPVSGVCANGVISCTPGTFSNCNHYTWTVDAAGNLALASTNIRNLGGCYCVNNSCGNNLPFTNLNNILGDLGSGALAALAAVDARYAASETLISGTSITYKGQRYAGCTGAAPAAGQQSYLHNPATLTQDAVNLAGSGTHDVLDAVLNSQPAQTIAGNTAQCRIERVATLEELNLNNFSNLLQYCSTGTEKYRRDISFGINMTLRVTCGPAPDGFTFELIDRRNGDTLTMTVPAAIQPGTGSFPGRFNFSNADWVKAWQNGSAQGCDLNATCRYSLHFYWRRRGNSDHQTDIDIAFQLVDPANACSAQESFNDTCSALAANPECRLRTETVDGVITVQGGNATGVTPLASTVTLPGRFCSVDVTRPWWIKEQTWVCDPGPGINFGSTFDRMQAIQDSATVDGFTQITENPDGTWASTDVNFNSTLTPVINVGSCEMACKTREPVQDTGVAGTHLAQDLRNTPIRYQFRYHRCEPPPAGSSAAGVCPAGPNEQILQNCQCLNEFAEAAALMQTLRQAAQDTICTSGTEQSLF